MQAYRSGHNEAVLKTVWGKPHGGSNPSACAKNTGMLDGIPVFLLCTEGAEGFEGGSRFAGAKRFATRNLKMRNLVAKDDVDNVGAGRAAKGANPSACAKATCINFLM